MHCALCSAKQFLFYFRRTNSWQQNRNVLSILFSILYNYFHTVSCPMIFLLYLLIISFHILFHIFSFFLIMFLSCLIIFWSCLITFLHYLIIFLSHLVIFFAYLITFLPYLIIFLSYLSYLITFLVLSYYFLILSYNFLTLSNYFLILSINLLSGMVVEPLFQTWVTWCWPRGWCVAVTSASQPSPAAGMPPGVCNRVKTQKI